MIRSISCSRYLSTAIAMAAHRHANARSWSTLAATEYRTTDTMNVATTSRAAAANHFSHSRSSPEDPTNLTTTAATLTSNAAGRRIRNGVGAAVLWA